MRRRLEEAFPGKSSCHSDVYLSSVLDVPGRATDYAIDKMLAVMKWREDFGAEPDMWKQPDIRQNLANGSMVLRGFDRLNRPVFWVRPLLKNWSNMDREAELRAHVAIIELAIASMPPDVTTFTIVADAAGLGLRHNDPGLMKALTRVVIKAYPDRLGAVCVGPVNALVRIMYRLLRPILPHRIASKVHLMKDVAKELDAVLDKDALTPLPDPDHELDLDGMVATFQAQADALRRR